GNLTAGTYSLQVTDGLCTLDTSIVVPESSSATLDYPDTISIIALGDSVLLRPLDTGFLSVDSVAWSPASLFSEPNELETWVHPDGTTRFKVEAWTPEGCHLSDWVLVLVDPTRHVFVPNVFHPGADDEDGRFNIFPDPSSAVKINWVRVFDRWGDMVYFGKNLSTIPGPTDGWDGTWRGKPASKGVYVWTAEIEFVDGKNELFTGSITLTR
ncbi:MAG: gliding motility-associated C-terminal domain-containing protein, partial [Saprospiraceae bacterium]